MLRVLPSLEMHKQTLRDIQNSIFYKPLDGVNIIVEVGCFSVRILLANILEEFGGHLIFQIRGVEKTNQHGISLIFRSEKR